MGRYLAGEVVIEILDADAAVEQGDERGAVDGHRDIERGDRIARLRGDPLQQRNIPLDTGHENRILRRGEPKLMQCADAVGIAVEYVKMSHCLDPSIRHGHGEPDRLPRDWKKGSS
jgi:hypothetical protein